MRQFLAAGNGVLVIGQQDGGYPLAPAAQFANSVSGPYGIELTTVTPNTRTPPASSQLVPHPITRGLASVPGDGSLLRVTPPAQVLALSGETNTGVLAVSTYGTGRLIVVSDDSNIWDDSIDPKYTWTAERYKYAQNIFEWLLAKPPRLSAHLDTGGWHLSFMAAAGQNVTVQRSGDLVKWTDWKTLAATGTWQELADTPSTGVQFYRVLLTE